MGEASTRRRDARRGAAALVAAFALLAGGCSVISSGGNEGETVAETTEPTAVPTTAASAADEPTATSEAESTAPAESLEPVPVEAELDVLLAVVEDMHGPTSDITAQMNRLISYPELPTPTGAHIAGIYARVNTTFDDENRFDIWAEADFFADGTVDDLSLFYETQLPPLGWNLVKTATDTRFDGAPITVLNFELPGASARSTELLEVTLVEDSELPELLVETRYTGAPTEERIYLDRFIGWYDPIVVPAGARIQGAILDTTAGEGRTTVTIDTEHRYDGGSDTALLDQLNELAAASGLERAETSRSDAVAFVSSLLDDYYYSVYGSSSGYATVTAEASTKFVNPELDAAAVVADDKPTDPLPDFATAEQIEALVTEIHGPTLDIAGQMNRLGPFPDLPTPIGSSVVELTAAVNDVIGNDDELAHIGAVTFRVAGTKEDTLLFFETQAAALGWQETSRADESDDDGLTTTTTIEYAIPGVDAGSGAPFELVVDDDVDKSDVVVEWTYVELVAKNRANTERWLGWQGGAPLPEGGTVADLGVSTDGLFGQAIFFFTEYRYESEEDAIRAEIESLVPGSDYGLSEGAVESRLYLTHPFFTDAFVGFYSAGSGSTIVDLNTQRPLQS